MQIKIPNTAGLRAELAVCHAPILRVGNAGAAAESNKCADRRGGCKRPRGSATLKQRRHLRSPQGVGCGNPPARTARALHCSQHIGRRHVGC